MMSHLFLLLFFLLPGLIYLLDLIREYPGITYHEALSCAKLISPSERFFPAPSLEKVGKHFLCVSKRWGEGTPGI